MSLVLPFIAPVNGITFHLGQAKLAKEGDLITIKHASSNTYDSKAMEIIHQGNAIGFLPKEIAHRLFDQGLKTFSGIIAQVLSSEKGFGLRVKVLSVAEDAKESFVEPHQSELYISNRQGRLLGKYHSNDNERVSVLHTSGRIISYPIPLTNFSTNLLITS